MLPATFQLSLNCKKFISEILKLLSKKLDLCLLMRAVNNNKKLLPTKLSGTLSSKNSEQITYFDVNYQKLQLQVQKFLKQEIVTWQDNKTLIIRPVPVINYYLSILV